MFGLIVAVIDTAVLWAMGIPAAVLWGLLAFVTNYIPNIGFIIGLVPVAVLALLEGGVGLMLAVIAVYSVINLVIQSIIQPRVVGDRWACPPPSPSCPWSCGPGSWVPSVRCWPSR